MLDGDKPASGLPNHDGFLIAEIELILRHPSKQGSWADADRFGPGYFEWMGRWPGIAFEFALTCLESQFPVADAIKQGIVSAERDGYVVSGQRSIRSHSLAQSEAAGQVIEPRQIHKAQRANRSILPVRSSTRRPARWATP